MACTPEEKLLNPRQGSKIAAARDFGIDLTLLVGNLRLTPVERLRNSETAVNDLPRFELAMKNARLASKNIRK
jgi:hypothetical protein